MTLRVMVDYQATDGVRCEYATTLGAGGLFIETDRPLASGTPLRVRFRLGGSDRTHEIDGRVAWTQPPGAAGASVRTPGMGIEFTDSAASSVLARDLDGIAGTPA